MEDIFGKNGGNPLVKMEDSFGINKRVRNTFERVKTSLEALT